MRMAGCCCCSGFGSPKSVPKTTPHYPSSAFRLRFKPRSVSISTPASASASAAADESAEDSAGVRRRRLILLRHAESLFTDRFIKDHDRPLSKVGRMDAIAIAHKLEEMGWIPQLILSSDAARTKETLEILREKGSGLRDARVQFVPSFYSIAAMDGQTADHLQRAICELSTDQILTIMCMGHNRGWEEAASMLCGNKVELKTCNAALLEACGKSWIEAFSSAGLGGWKLHGILKP